MIITSGASHSDGSCVWVESIVAYHWISWKKCITYWRITLSIYNIYRKHDYSIVCSGGKLYTSSFNLHRNFPTLSITFNFILNIICVPYIFRKFIFHEITIMKRHYVTHLHLMIRHYVIHPTITKYKYSYYSWKSCINKIDACYVIPMC